MGNVVGSGGGRARIGGDDDAPDNISEFEHSFAASLEDATPGVIPEPLAGYTPSPGPPPTRRRGSVDTISEPLKGRLMTVHMMATELVVKEVVGVSERTVACIPYAAIRQLTWDHSQSALKLDHTPSSALVADSPEGGRGTSNLEGGGGDGASVGNNPKGAYPGEGVVGDEADGRGINAGGGGDCADDRAVRLGKDDVFLSFRVENSIDLEDELGRRACAESKGTAKATGEGGGESASASSTPASVYLGMFASFTKPKPFQRKRPNLSCTVLEGELPSLKDMRSWSLEEHESIGRPQICSLRPKLAMDSVFLGENRFPLSAVEGLVMSPPKPSDIRHRSRYGDLVLTFASVEVHLRSNLGKNIVISYDNIHDWSMISVPGNGSRASSGIELWVILDGRANETSLSGGRGGEGGEDGGGVGAGKKSEALVVYSEEESRRHRPRRVFLGVHEEDLILARNAMEYFWNTRRAELRLPPKACSTHGRSVASIVTLRGEVKSPALPTGRISPLGLNGINVRIGQVVQPSPNRGHIKLLPSPRALLGVEKKRTLRCNHRARMQWERVVLHQGWLRKRGGGAIKRWIWRYFVLYDTPQGHFLAYYNDVSEVPLFDEGRRHRQLVDLCKVCYLRPEIGRTRPPACELPPNAFSIITTEREWTLCADKKATVLEWLRMISVAIDEDVAVVDDGEILFHVKAHWSSQGGEYGPESTGTVHLGSMGMELRVGCLESTATPSAGHTKTCAGSAASRCTGTRFWSFTDFYKWTLMLLQDGASGLAVECFTDEKFDTKESVLLVTPHAKRMALAIEHQVEKFMAVMHLRLEQPEKMGQPSSLPRSDNFGAATTINESGEENEATFGIRPKGAGSPLREMHRITSMNLETDPSAWGADDIPSPKATGRRPPPGPDSNPFDYSSSEEDDSEVSASTSERGGHDSSGPIKPAKLTIDTCNNPFDLALDGCGEPEGTWGVGGTGGSNGTGQACQHAGTDEFMASVVLDDLSSGVPQLLPAPSPPSAVVQSITPERVHPFPPDSCTNSSFDLQHFGVQAGGQTGNQIDPFAPPPLPARCSASTASPTTTVPDEDPLLLLGGGDVGAANARGAYQIREAEVAGKNLSPAPLIFFGEEEDLSSCPTPPVTPFATPASDGRTDLAHIRDEPSGTPSFVRPPELPKQSQTMFGSMAVSPESRQSNPFARPELPQATTPVAGKPLPPPPAGQVIYDDRSSPRVILEDCVNNGQICSIRLRYEFRTPHQTKLSVGTPQGMTATTYPVNVSFNPKIAGAGVGAEGGGEAGGAWGARYLRQELLVTCTRAFSSSPEVALTTADQDGRMITKTLFALPVTVTMFMAGFPVTADTFRQEWTALSSAEHVAQAVVSCCGQKSASSRDSVVSSEGSHRGGRSSVSPATLRRLLVETLGMEEIALGGKGAEEEVELVAAAGVLLVPDMKGNACLQTCLVGVELHGQSGMARVTSKSAESVLAQGVQKDLLEGIRRLAEGRITC